MAETRRPRILVIDDEAIWRDTIRLVLEQEDWDVFEAGDGATALEPLAHGLRCEVVFRTCRRSTRCGSRGNQAPQPRRAGSSPSAKMLHTLRFTPTESPIGGDPAGMAFLYATTQQSRSQTPEVAADASRASHRAPHAGSAWSPA